MESFKKGFDALCKDAGILHDRYGDKRAPYSLRHTYATFALLYGRVSVYTLAVNMGHQRGHDREALWPREAAPGPQGADGQV